MIRKHLKQRHLDVDMYHCHVDDEADKVTFWLADDRLRLAGILQYYPNGSKDTTDSNSKYFSKSSKEGMVPLFGMETFHWSPEVIFLSEGAFDAIRPANRGYTSLAMLSSNVHKRTRNWITSRGRRTILVRDNDHLLESTKRERDHIKNFVDDIYIPAAEDMAAMTEDEIDHMLAVLGLPRYNEHPKT